MRWRNYFLTLFLKLQLSISLDEQFKASYCMFLLYVQVEDYGNILKLRCRPLGFTSCKAFLKKQSFEEKHFSRYIFVTDQSSLSSLLYF